MAAGYGLDLPGSFDEEQAEIERRRLQLIGAMQRPIGGAGTGWGGGLANFLQGAAGNTLLAGQADKGKDLAARRAAFAEQAMERLGKLDRPATPEINPSMPPPSLEGLGGGPPLPETYKQPPIQPAGGDLASQGPEGGLQPIPNAPLGGPQPGDLQPMPYTPPPGGEVPQMMEMPPAGGMVPRPSYEYAAAKPMIPGSLSERMKIVSQLASAGPMYAKVAEKVLTQGLEAPEKAEQARLAREAKAEELAKGRTQRVHELTLKHIEAGSAAEKKAIEARVLEETKHMNRMERDAELAKFRMAIKAVGSGGGEKGTWVDAGTAPSGNVLLRKGTSLVEMVNGEPVPYKGPIVAKGEAKTVEKAMDSKTQLEYTEDLAKRAADPKNAKAFSTAANIGGVLSGKTEGFVSEEAFGKLTDEQSNIRGEVGRNFAELMHKLYGSAYTANEKSSAARFAVLPGMDAKTVARKLEQQVEFQRKMHEKYGEKITGAAEARTGGDTRPPISGL